MKQKWRNIFWGTVLIFLIGIIFSAFLFQDLFIKSISVINILVKIFVAIIGVFGLFYHHEYKRNLDFKKNNDSEKRRIISEMRNNIDTLEKIKGYMEINHINTIYLYPDDKYEFWELNNGTKKEVECKNNKGILNQWKLSDRCKDYEYVQSSESLLSHYSFITSFNSTNGFNLDGIKNIINQIKILLEKVES